MKEIGLRLHLSKPTIEKALEIYDKIYKMNSLKGMLVRAKQATVIFLAGKLSRQPKTIEKVL